MKQFEYCRKKQKYFCLCWKAIRISFSSLFLPVGYTNNLFFLAPFQNSFFFRVLDCWLSLNLGDRLERAKERAEIDEREETHARQVPAKKRLKAREKTGPRGEAKKEHKSDFTQYWNLLCILYSVHACFPFIVLMTKQSFRCSA